MLDQGQNTYGRYPVNYKYMLYTPRINRALATAARAHAGQSRKGTDIPYIAHPMAVALIVSEYTDDEDTVIAALFHDILEDVPPLIYSANQMEKEFGQWVVTYVKGVSEDKMADEAEKPWKTRKLGYLSHLEAVESEQIVLISAADKLHNLLSTLEDYQIYGEQTWQRFNAPKEDQLWFYGAALTTMQNKLPTHRLIDRLAKEVTNLESVIQSSTSEKV